MEVLLIFFVCDIARGRVTHLEPALNISLTYIYIHRYIYIVGRKKTHTCEYKCLFTRIHMYVYIYTHMYM